MIEKLFFLSLLTVAVLFSPRAGAVITLQPMVEGLSGGMYKPLSVPALTGANFSATGQVLVNGRFVPIPGYIPPASTAAQAARTSLWLNPWLVGAALLTWAGDAGLGSDQVNGGGWVMAGGDPAQTLPADTPLKTMYSTGPNGPWFDSPQAVCVLYGPPTYVSCVANGSTLDVYNGASHYYIQVGSYPNQCPAGYSGSPCTLTWPQYAEPAADRPATQADFDALPPPPATALAELAPQVGVPVDDPVYSPADVAIGDPYTRADGSTAQPRAKISPAGDGEVYVDTYEMPLTDSTGAPVSNPAPQDTQEPQPPAPTQCDKYPNSLGCANLDSPLAEDLQTEARGPSLISPVSLGGAGSCPAPLTATVMGHVVEMSFDPLCQYANALRPLVLALAWLSAGVLFIGGVRNG